MFRSVQRGFTRIELVVVIVILGILAAVALPKFMGLEDQARIAALNGMTGSIRSAANMAHGVWLANGNTGTITVDGASITMVNGYPNAAGIQSLTQDSTGFGITRSGTTATFTPNDARTPATCNVVYKEATATLPFTITVQPAATLQTSC
ncbi:MAG TPA: prepilin-type N-terminal cleavage/methylation domain-containing protein [Steroidobacteraceae bacterium]|jgi:MSHA pilin protein MshA|nr:prepilin-type N-terminal cleavage/methylation domain-containing protein [Steroidobacteraceae bacterium]